MPPEAQQTEDGRPADEPIVSTSDAQALDVVLDDVPEPPQAPDAGEEPAQGETAGDATPPVQEGQGADDSGREADGEDAADAQQDGPARRGKKKGKSARERIDELTRARREAEREALRLKRELEAERAAKRARQPEAQAPTPPPPQDDLPPEPKEEDFESYQAYLDARIDWRNEVNRRTAQQQEPPHPPEPPAQGGPDAAQPADDAAAGIDEEALLNFRHQMEDAMERYDDFEEKVLAEDLPITPEMFQVLARSDKAADVAYALASDPDRALEIAKLTDPIAIAREIGKVEATLDIPGAPAQEAGDEETTKPETPPPSKKVTSAPGPIEPVGESDSGSRNDPDKMSYDDYVRWRLKQMERERA